MAFLLLVVVSLGFFGPSSVFPPLAPATDPVLPTFAPQHFGLSPRQLAVVYSAISLTVLLIVIEAVLTIYCRRRSRSRRPESDADGVLLADTMETE
jgi:hypothetical protein